MIIQLNLTVTFNIIFDETQGDLLRSIGHYFVLSLVTTDLDSKIGQPPSLRQDSDNHVIHRSDTESNTQVRNLKLVVNHHLHVDTLTVTQAYHKISQHGLLALEGYSRMFIHSLITHD